MKKLLSKQGFTLIELLIVITIIGILAAAFLPNILGAPARARDASRQGDLNKIVAAVEIFNADTGAYPEQDAMSTCVHDIVGLGTYFPAGIPEDPDSATSIGGCTGGYFYCRLDGTAGNYLLAADTEDNAENADKMNLTTGAGSCVDGTAPITPNPGLFTPAGAYAIVN